MPSRSKLRIKEETTDKFIAFLDVLGFKELVNKNSFKDLDSYFSKLTDVLFSLRAKSEKIDSVIISDSIILIAPPGLKGFKDLLKAIQTIQSQLLWRKIILRGAVSFGPIYYNDSKNIIVGKGYVRAYLLEQEASFPRVIIDPAIIKLFETDKEGFLKTVNGTLDFNFEKRLIYKPAPDSKLPDDAIFVDYANQIIKENEIKGSIQTLYETIRENLYSEQKLFSKYTWLKEYFYECIDQTYQHVGNKRATDTLLYESELTEWANKFNRLNQRSFNLIDRIGLIRTIFISFNPVFELG